MRDEVLAFKREKILQVAIALFFERGFNGTTLDDIAHELGVTKPFIYTHFKSKTDLLGAICVPAAELSVAAAAAALKVAGTASERLRRLVNDFTRIVIEHRAAIAIYFREEKSLSAEMRAEIDALRKKFDRLLTKILQDGVTTGEFSVEDIGLTTLAITGMVTWIYIWHRPSGRLPVEELCGQIGKLALRVAGVE